MRRLLVDQRVDVVHSHGYDATWWASAALATLRGPDRSAAHTRVFAVVPNGIPLRPVRRAEPDARTRWNLPAGVPLVGAIGRLSGEKRHDVLVAACRAIAAQRSDVHFVLAGGGPLRAELARSAADAGLAARFHLLGLVEDPELLLSELAVLVQPSDTETTSRVVLEAMMQARPVVATDVGGTATLLRHGVDGIVVPRGDHERIAAEVLALLAAPELGERLGASARRSATAGFAATDMAAAVDDVYSAVLGRGSVLHGTWTRP